MKTKEICGKKWKLVVDFSIDRILVGNAKFSGLAIGPYCGCRAIALSRPGTSVTHPARRTIALLATLCHQAIRSSRVAPYLFLHTSKARTFSWGDSFPLIHSTTDRNFQLI
jgi:hypothetical protein